MDDLLKAVVVVNAGAALAGIRQAYRNDPRVDRGYLRGRSMKRTAPPSSRLVTPQKRFRSAPTSMPRRYRNTGSLGDAVGSYGTKKHTLFSDTNQSDEKELNEFRLIQIPHTTNNRDFDKRLSNICNVRGVKLSMWFKLAPTARVPMSVRAAIIYPRKNNDGSGTLDTSKFFTAWNPEDKLTEPFPTGTNPGDTFKFMEQQINPKYWVTLKQWRFVLRTPVAYNQTGEGDTDWVQKVPRSEKHIQAYVRLNRQFEWDDDQNDFPNTNVYFVWWFHPYGDTTASKTILAGVQEKHRKTVYFKTPAILS